MERIEHLPRATSPGPWLPLALLLALVLSAVGAAHLSAAHAVEQSEAQRIAEAERPRRHRATGAEAFAGMAEGPAELTDTDRAWLRGFAAGLAAQVEGDR